MTTASTSQIPKVFTYRFHPGMPNPLGNETSTILISNLHCNSCVQSIEHALAPLSPYSVEVDIVSQSVTIHHDGIPLRDMEEAIEDAGFDVVRALPSTSTFPVPLPRSSETLTPRQQAHLNRCHYCQEARRSSEDGESLFNHKRMCRMTISIGGMTCASCTFSVMRAVMDVGGVVDVSVDLVGKSAVVMADEQVADSVVEAIEDCGFEAQLFKVESLTESSPPVAATTRTVLLRIEGMFCQHCPDKVTGILTSLGVIITKPISDLSHPIVTVTYQPNAPRLTVRTLLNSLPPPFKATIYHPPSLSDLARTMQEKEKTYLLYRLALSVIVAIPTFIIGIVYMMLVKDGNPTKDYLMRPMWAGNVSRAEWALLFLSTPVMFYGASIFHTRSLKEVYALWRKGSKATWGKRLTRFGSMNLLVSSGVSIGYFASVVLLIMAARQPPSQHDMDDKTTYFDTTVFLTMFLLAGRYLESYSKARTADAVSALGQLRPTKAILVTSSDHKSEKQDSNSLDPHPDLERGLSNDSMITRVGTNVQEVPIDQLEIGDIVRVPQGSSPPADGIILPGYSSSFDESSLTGESKPVIKQAEDRVFVGTINKGRMIEMKVEEVEGTTMLENIVKVVQEGQTHRAPIERVAAVITGYFVPIVTLVGISTWFIWMGLGLGGVLPVDYLDISTGGWPVWALQFAIATFVVACPCGIGLAAPTALLVGSGLAAKFGILARGGGEAFQEMAQLDLLVFDKTGTLTEGSNPQVTDTKIFPLPRVQDIEILGIAFTLENASSHPLAMAIRDYCSSHSAQSLQGQDFDETPGKGLRALLETSQGKLIAIIGSEAWMEEHHVQIDAQTRNTLDDWKSGGKSVVLLAISLCDSQQPPNFQLVGAFAIMDPPRPEAKDVICNLQQSGIQTWMISGDNAKTAAAVAAMVGIPATNVLAEVLPHQKSEAVRRLQLEGAKKVSRFGGPKLNKRCIVGMVGDGVNDAPALTVADVGIAIGSGSDVAISSASFILLSSNLKSLLTLSDLSQRVFRRVIFNFIWAAIYNIAAIPIAAGVIYPAGHVRLDPAWAALAMALSSVSVVCSSLLLKLYREPKL